MSELALFPLNTVLFPGMQLKLHIFEERYKLLINKCVEENLSFGIVLIENGQEALGPLAKPHNVGCAAHVTEVQRLPFERMNIVVTGQQRFRINEITEFIPYLVGDVDYFSPADDKPELIAYLGKKLRPLIVRYLEILTQVGEVQFNPLHIPDDPKSLAHVAAIILQCENSLKQKLLSADTTLELLAYLYRIYRLEAKLIEVRSEPPGDDFSIGPFSSN